MLDWWPPIVRGFPGGKLLTIVIGNHTFEKSCFI